MKGGAQKYRCPECRKGSRRFRGCTSRAKYTKLPADERPSCVQRKGTMARHGKYKKTITRWYCRRCRVEVQVRASFEVVL